jgi:hypothetical protein
VFLFTHFVLIESGIVGVSGGTAGIAFGSVSLRFLFLVFGASLIFRGGLCFVYTVYRQRGQCD